MKAFLLIGASSLALFGQKLEVSSTSVSPGDKATVEISIVLPKGAEVLGIQWETIFPGKQMVAEGAGPEVSDAAKAAGKTLTCAKKVANEVQSYTCILIGGQKTIESGPIAILKLATSPQAAPGKTMIRVGHIDVVTKNLRKHSLSEAEGSVTVK